MMMTRRKGTATGGDDGDTVSRMDIVQDGSLLRHSAVPTVVRVYDTE
jgi:hypothetical protein